MCKTEQPIGIRDAKGRKCRVRRLLRKGLAVVVDYRPFTIQLTYDTPNGVQEVSLGVDAGTKHVGLSATTKKKVLFEAELLLRSDIVEKLSTRREFRRTRRNRKTRYRKSRFLNRTGSKKPVLVLFFTKMILSRSSKFVVKVKDICNF